MRWEDLFADLEAELAAAEAAELADEVADRTRRALAAVKLGDRLRAAVGAPVELAVLGGSRIRGPLRAVGPDWVLVEESTGEALVPQAALGSVGGIGALAEPSTSVVEARLDLASALRGLARRRAAVRLELRDSAQLAGTIDRVGADALDLAVHPQGEARRASAVRQVAVIPLSALAVVRAEAGS